MEKRGISLVVLVITIIVLTILAGAVIISLSNSGIIARGNEAVFKANVDSYKTELALYIADQIITDSSFSASTFDATTSTTPSITTVIPSMTTEDSEKFSVDNGSLVYVGDNESEIGWATALGIYEAE